MATLYSQAESNTRKTWILMFFFVILVLGLGWLFSHIFETYLFLIIACFLAVLMSFSSYWYSDKIVLAMAKAKLIEKKDNPELYRIVENLSITAGLPMPKIYIIEEEQPNAFATGRDSKHAVVAVTRGLLNKLEKVELEGVIAHELSHIKNRDILLGTVIVVLAGIIVLLSEFFWRAHLYRGRRSNREGYLQLVLLLIGVAAALIAPLMATLVRLAVSRKREFLADADGALLTRYPEGLARALRKIADDSNVMKSAKNATAHLYIANPFRGKEKKKFLPKLFMTHPPVEERIEALMGIKI